MITSHFVTYRFLTKFVVVILTAFAFSVNSSYSEQIALKTALPEGNTLIASDFQAIQEKTIIQYLQYHEVPSYTRSQDRVHLPPLPAEWKEFDRRYIDFGFTGSFIWLKLRIVNKSDKPITRILDLNSRFMNEMHVYIDDGENLKTLLSENEDSKFSSRPINNRYLATEFNLKPNVPKTIYIGYWSRGSTVLPLAIYSEKEYYLDWVKSNIGTVTFSSIILFLLAFGFFQYLISRSVVQLAYVGYVGSGSLYIYHMDGLSFKFLWPNFPELNAIAALYLGLSINLFAVAFARTFLGSREKYPKSDKLLLTLFFLCVLVIVVSLFSDARILKKIAFYLTTATTLSCAIVGVVALRNGQTEARFYVAGWFAIATCAAFITIANTFKDTLHVFVGYDFAKLGVFFDAIMFAMAMADQSNEVRKQRDIANEKQKSLLKKELETRKQITLLEDQYQSVMSVAQSKSQKLATAGHDLRQPILTLRAAMQAAIKQGLPDNAELNQFKKGFDYIETLIREYLDVPEEIKHEASRSSLVNHQDDVPISKHESFSIMIVLDNIDAMFRSEAENKRLRFSCAPCSQTVFANPIVIMRILSNLCENAIKYTEEGKVLVGCRRRNAELEIQVIDTGLGIPEESQKNIFEIYRRDNEKKVPGLGLGLSIVTKLIEEEGYTLELKTKPGKGSMFSFSIPLQST